MIVKSGTTVREAMSDQSEDVEEPEAAESDADAGSEIARMEAEAREEARRVECRSSQHQFTIGLASYATEHHRFVPLRHITHKQYSYILYRPSALPWNSPFGQFYQGGQLQLMYAWTCPSSEQEIEHLWSPGSVPGAHLRADWSGRPALEPGNNDQAWNWGNGINTQHYARLADLRPNYTMIADRVSIAVHVPLRHAAGVNIGRADGSVRWVPLADFEEDLSQLSAPFDTAQNPAFQRVFDTFDGLSPTP